MRYDVPVYFQSVSPGEYDALTGNYAPDTVTETMVLASVSDTATETMQLLYGGIKQGSLAVRIQNHFTTPFDSIRIGNKTYRVDKSRLLRTKQTFIVSEVQ